MVKSIIKEIFIILLLMLSILLVLAILFYEYRPSTKYIPTISSKYSLPEDMQKELEETISTKQNIVKTYKVDSDDLYKYEKSNDYDKGKDNPFDGITPSINEVNETPQDDNNGGGKFSNMVK